MKQLLENNFTVAHGRAAGSVMVIENTCPAGSFTIADAAACGACSYFFKMNCNQTVLKVHAATEVRQIEFEYFINAFPRITGQRCDFIFHDAGQKIVLSDLTCSRSEYIDTHLRDGKPEIGKRAKVRGQIEESIKKLYAVPAIAAHINTFPQKRGLFAYRLRDEELSSNLAATLARRKKEFLGEAESLGKRRLALQMVNGFVFTENKYPDVYQW